MISPARILSSSAPLGLVLAMAGSVGAMAHVSASSPDSGGVPLPPVADPLLAWTLQILASLVVAAVVPVGGWLALRLVLLATSATSASIRALAAFIRAHVRRTPSPLDDAPGERMARDLDKMAADLDADAARKRGA